MKIFDQKTLEVVECGWRMLNCQLEAGELAAVGQTAGG